MAFMNIFKNRTKPEPKTEPEVQAETKPTPRPKKEKEKPVTKTEKELATERGEAWVTVTRIELDPKNMGNGAIELDWNDKFITNLVRQGYQVKAGEEESTIVDRWFQDMCRNVIQENFEQWEANQPYEVRPRIVDRRDLGNGKTEVS